MSLAFQAGSVVRSPGLRGFTVKHYPGGTVTVKFENPHDQAAATCERGGRAHQANSRRAQTPALSAVANP